MPENVSALVYISFISLCGLGFVWLMVKPEVFRDSAVRIAPIWLFVLALMFITRDFWIFAAVMTVAGLFWAAKGNRHLELFIIIVLGTPLVTQNIGLGGVIGSFLQPDMGIMIAMLVVLPLHLLKQRQGQPPRQRNAADVFLVLYVVYTTLILARDANITSLLRSGVEAAIGILVVYFAFSRGLRTQDDVREVSASFVIVMMVFSGIALFEIVKYWHPFAQVQNAWAWGTSGNFQFIERAGILRPTGPAGGSIAFGCAFLMAMGLASVFWGDRQRSAGFLAVFASLVVGLLAALARGPWVGAAALFATYVATGPHAGRRLAGIGFAGAFTLAGLLLTPFGQKLLDFLPFVGSIDAENVSYRQRLFLTGMQVFEQSPLIGTIDYRNTPEMQTMIQGQGIVDMVNTYLDVALGTGAIGLVLFLGFFASVLAGLWRAIRSLPPDADETKRAARALFATLVALLVVIATTSSVGPVKYLYWICAGLCVAQTRIIAAKAAVKAPAPRTVSGLEARPSPRGQVGSPRRL